MEWIETMHRAIAYMEEHLLEEINYEDVARHVHTSSYEFHRAFSFLSGIRPIPISATADCLWQAGRLWRVMPELRILR